MLHGVNAVLRGLPGADRAPAGDRRSAPCCRCSATAADRVMVCATLASFVALAAGLYRLGAARLRPARRARRRRRCCARASTSRSSRPAATSTSRTWRSSSGRRRSRPSDRGAATPVFVLLACAGLHAPGGVAAERALLAVVAVRRHWRAARRYAALAGASAGDLGRGRLVGTGRAAVLADPHQRPGRGAGPHQRRSGRDPAATGAVPQEPRQGAGLLRRHPGPGHRRCCSTPRRARDAGGRCWSSAWARSCWSASPACRSSTAICSCRR